MHVECTHVVPCPIQLDIATSHGMEPKEVSKILFSIAETLADKKQYNEAMSYYQKELDMCEQPEEVRIFHVSTSNQSHLYHV